MKPENQELPQEVSSLFQRGFSKKGISRKLGINVKRVRRLLKKAGLSSPAGMKQPSKLEPFRETIQHKVQTGLSTERILREIREQGYEGGKTILGDYVRSIRPPAKQSTKTFRRFETAPAQEAQVDWSPYRLQIAGRETVVHCFAMVLAFSRYLFIQMHRDEKLPTLLQAHVEAFDFFGGCPVTVFYDNMATVTLGRSQGGVIWNPRFLDFTRHWMFEPRLCRPRDPNRKGKIESPFAYIESSFLRGRSFASWEELDREAEKWLREVANQRIHGTTHRVPGQMWLEERALLTAAPQSPFPTYREEIRTAYHDATISVGGVLYSVPATLARNTLSVRVYPRHLEVFDARGVLQATHRIPEPPCGLVIGEGHYDSIRRDPKVNAGESARRFLARFPQSEAFLEGLKTRMKSLHPIHLRKIDELVQIYGLENTRIALEKATEYRNFNANALERILRQHHPLLCVEPLEGSPPLAKGCGEIADLEIGSLEEYRAHSSEASNEEEEKP